MPKSRKLARVVLDTNVIVSALLTPEGNAARVLAVVLSGSYAILVDQRIIGEYQTVLLRSKFKFPQSSILALLNTLTHLAEHIIALPLAATLPDEDDLPFLEVAITGNADYLVTGNSKHFPQTLAKKFGLEIVTPSEFLTKVAIS